MFMTGQNINIMNSCATLTTADFFREMPGIPKATVYSRIRSMVIRGIVQRVGRGVYERTGKSAFAFEASESMRAIASSITKDFPYINYCVWDLSPINTLAQHLINFNVTIVDVDREAVEAVYQRLRDIHEKVLTTKRMFDGLADYNGFILVTASLYRHWRNSWWTLHWIKSSSFSRDMKSSTSSLTQIRSMP